MNINMSKQEEAVIDAIKRILDEIREELHTANMAFEVIATEVYLTRRELTNVLKRMEQVNNKLAETKPELKQPAVAEVQEEAQKKEFVFPKSTLPLPHEETE